jgi:hypothetical protein
MARDTGLLDANAQPTGKLFMPNRTFSALITGIAIASGMTTISPAHAAESVSAECRGIAAGVVASMRSAGELSGDEETSAAVLAARRACDAALGDLQRGASAPASAAGKQSEAVAQGDQASADASQEKTAEDEPSVWDLLTRDRELKPGNERLRRLKQQ